MISIRRLTLSNFLSFKEFDVTFSSNPFTMLVLGINKTDNGQKSNGSGKSAIQASIEYALTGSCSRKVRNIGLIRKGCDEACVDIILHNSKTNEVIKINRIIPSKGSAIVKIFINDSPVEYSDLNEWFIKYLQIIRVDLFNYFLPNELNYVSFFSNSDTKKKEIVSRFTGSEVIENVFVDIEKQIKKLTEKDRLLQNDVIANKTRIDMINDMILKELDNDPEVLRTNMLNELNSDIDEKNLSINTINDCVITINDRIKSFMTIRKQLNESLVELKAKLELIGEDVDTSSLEEIIKKLRKNRDKALVDLSDVRGMLLGFKEDISSLNRSLEGMLECPDCGFEFNPSIELSPKEIKKKIKETEVHLSSAETIIETLKNKIKNIEVNIAEKNKELLTLVSLQDDNRAKRQTLNKQITNVESELARINVKVSALKSEITVKNESIEKIREEIKGIEKRIKEVKVMVIPQSDQLIKLKSDLVKEENTEKEIMNSCEQSRQNILSLEAKEKMFLKFKSYLVNRKLKIIESEVNKYLKSIESDLVIFIDGFKLLADGRLKENITAQIVKEGSIVEYGSLSKGERVRIDMCTLLTLQGFINQSCENGGFNFLFCDEITDGLDSLGLESLLNSLSKTSKNILLTTQLAMEEVYDNCLIIEKINGISKIK